MDLRKIFVYVQTADYNSFAATYLTDGKPNAACKSTFANKIIFLEKTNQIIAKGEYYGTNPADIEAIYTLIGAQTLSETVGETTYTDFYNWIKALDGAQTAANTALEAKLPAVAVEGSGLDIRVDTDSSTGKKTYTVIADQSIWEFMGGATATAATVATVLNGNYDGPSGTGEGKVHRNPEQGDVWAVTITDQSNNTVLYACDSVSGSTGTWVQIGSAQGISGVDTTASHGVALANTASVVSVSVTPGSVADGDTDVVTGGAVYTAVQAAQANAYAQSAADAQAAQDNAYAKAESEAAAAQTAAINASYAKAESEAAAAQANAYAQSAADAQAAQDNAYAKAESEAAAAQANAYAQSAADAQAAQDNAYAKAEAEAADAQANAYAYAQELVNGAIAGGAKSIVSGNSYAEVTYVGAADGYTYTVTVDNEAIFNYVSDNIWETFSAY